MAFPRKVKVLNTTYTVSWPETPEEEAFIETSWGKTQFPTQRILLHRKQLDDQLCESVLHEVIHTCLFQTTLGTDQEFADKYEEQLVYSLTPILLRVLRDNPKLAEYLLS